MITKKYYKLIRVSYADSDYFHVTNVSDQIGMLTLNGTNNLGKNLEYSTDGVNWTTADSNAQFSLNVPAGANVYMRGTNNNFGIQLHFDVNYHIGGNLMSIINKANYATMTSYNGGSNGDDHGFHGLFKNETNLIDASKLNFGQVNTVSNFMHETFFGCSNLMFAPDMSTLRSIGGNKSSAMFKGSGIVAAPDFSNLEAISGEAGRELFQGCNNLTVGADLRNVTNVGGNSCWTMFANCRNLTTVYTPNITTWNTGTFSNWLSYSAASGTIYAPTGSDIANYSGASGVPSGWTVVYY